MVDSENNPNICKTLKTSIVTIIKNPDLLRFVLYHLKIKNM